MKRVTTQKYNHDDRLDDLPDCVLLHILSFLDTKLAVQTSILSTRWKNLWKQIPTLSFSFSHFHNLNTFTKFVSQILSLRDDSVAVHVLDFHDNIVTWFYVLEKIIKYAVSHNIQQLQINITYLWSSYTICQYFYDVLENFSCHTLTSLNLSVVQSLDSQRTYFPNSLKLPALTTLSLQGFTFRINENDRVEPFLAFKRLSNLTIRFCRSRILGGQNLYISSVTLANLTIQSNNNAWDFRKIELYTPSLYKFVFNGTPFHKLCGSHLSSIKHVNTDAEPPSILLSWLLELTNIKSLTVTSNTLQVLSLVPDLLKTKFPSLCDLKSLKVKKKGISNDLSKALIGANLAKLHVWSQKEVVELQEAFKVGSSSIPNGIIDFLLQNSPSAQVDIID